MGSRTPATPRKHRPRSQRTINAAPGAFPDRPRATGKGTATWRETRPKHARHQCASQWDRWKQARPGPDTFNRRNTYPTQPCNRWQGQQRADGGAAGRQTRKTQCPHLPSMPGWRGVTPRTPTMPRAHPRCTHPEAETGGGVRRPAGEWHGGAETMVKKESSKNNFPHSRAPPLGGLQRRRGGIQHRCHRQTAFFHAPRRFPIHGRQRGAPHRTFKLFKPTPNLFPFFFFCDIVPLGSPQSVPSSPRP